MSIDLLNRVVSFQAADLSPFQKSVLKELARRADKNAMCFPSQGRIASDLGAKRESVNRAIKKLKNLGYITACKSSPYSSLCYIITTTKLMDFKSTKISTADQKPCDPKPQVCDLGSHDCDPNHPQGVIEDHRGCDRGSQGGVIEDHTNNNINNNIINNNNTRVPALDGGGVLLEKAGISKKKAELLALKYDVERIRQVLKSEPPSAGWIVKALEDNYTLPEKAPNLSILPISDDTRPIALVEADERQERAKNPEIRKRSLEARNLHFNRGKLTEISELTRRLKNEIQLSAYTSGFPILGQVLCVDGG